MDYYFDLSTSARWVGHAVGIVRVERELARRARTLDPAIQYCVYDRSLNQFHRLRPEIAAELLNGETRIAFEPTPQAAPQGSARFVLRETLIRLPLLYILFQRLKGRAFSLAEIAQIRREEASRRQADAPRVARALSLAEASDGVIAVARARRSSPAAWIGNTRTCGRSTTSSRRPGSATRRSSTT